MNKLIESFEIDIAVYKSSTAEAIQQNKGLKKYDHISRSRIFLFPVEGTTANSKW